MAFVKLDTGILDSTLWPERDARELFITALLMAAPCELTETAPQLKIDSIEHTGFVVPPGWYGFVRAAGIGIIRRSGMAIDVGMAALKALGGPDPESRSSDFEGRRLVRVDGGFVVLNYVKYRDRDNTAAERSRRWRQRQKELREQQSASVAQRRSATETDTRRHAPSRGDTIAEVEAEAEVILKSSKGGRGFVRGKQKAPPKFTQADFDERDLRLIAKAEGELSKLASQGKTFTDAEWIASVCSKVGIKPERYERLIDMQQHGRRNGKSL